MQETSVESYLINEKSGLNEKYDAMVLHIFKAAGAFGLTTNEMIANFHKNLDNVPDATPAEKVKGASLNNNLKGRRTDLTHRGLLKVESKRQCSITGRMVNYFTFVGSELSDKEQLENQWLRISEEIERLEKKRNEIMNKLRS